MSIKSPRETKKIPSLNKGNAIFPTSIANLVFPQPPSPIIEIILETGLFLIGVYLYYKTVTVKRKVAFWSLFVVFLLIHFMNMFGPPPPSTNAVAWSANLMWLFVFWAWWIEKE